MPSPSPCFVGTDVVYLVFAQASWTRAQAKAWAKKSGFRYGKVESAYGKWLVHQRPAKMFRGEKFRHVHVTRDVHAIVGCPRGPR